MKFTNLKEETLESIKAFSISGVIIVLFFQLVNNLRWLGGFFSSALQALAPFLFGIVFAFITVPLRRFVENDLLANVKWSKKTKRYVGVAAAMIVLLAGIVVFFAILIPQLASSLSIFIASFDGYVQTLRELIEKVNSGAPEIAQFLSNGVKLMGEKLTEWLTGAQGGLAQILSYSISFAKGIMNFFIGVIITMYLLLDEEKFKRQIKMFIYGIFEQGTAENLVHVMKLTAGTFNSFIFGKFVDSLIIGVICYICVTLMQMPYAPLIAFVVGITNMIPVFGPFIGAVPSTLILLIIDPFQALEFLVFILVLQQIDGNIIGPHILSDAVGLPTLWVMFAIIVGGAMFGVVGMFVGIPIFSVIYTLTEDWIHRRLREKKIYFPSEESKEQ
ncbi:MAG: AI-2E family transporter [Erysipelotrichaceae bacterium]|nr:AI-2E family transporter [Erysipelotrichaceae bacterium]